MAELNAPIFARLADWVEGRLSDEEAQQVAAQVAGAGAGARSAVAWLREFAALRGRVVLESPSAATRASLRHAFADYARAQHSPNLLQRVVAALTFDSGVQPLAAGLRGAGLAPRQMVYATEVLDIALHIQPRPQDQRFDINGQIFPKAALTAAAFGAQLLDGAEEVAASTVDDLGEFQFEALHAGRYAIALENNQYRVVLAQIELEQS